jgi:hypothetical protein
VVELPPGDVTRKSCTPQVSGEGGAARTGVHGEMEMFARNGGCSTCV